MNNSGYTLLNPIDDQIILYFQVFQVYTVKAIYHFSNKIPPIFCILTHLLKIQLKIK